jgi:Protein of unknown function (DUF1236)
MKTKTSIALAAAVLLSGAAAVSAAPMSHSTMGRTASDTITMSSAQRKTAWNDLNREAAKQMLPSGFNATVGSVVPTTFTIKPVPGKVAKAIPSLKPYDFAVVPGKLLIVNPSDKKIVEVISG